MHCIFRHVFGYLEKCFLCAAKKKRFRGFLIRFLKAAV